MVRWLWNSIDRPFWQRFFRLYLPVHLAVVLGVYIGMLIYVGTHCR